MTINLESSSAFSDRINAKIDGALQERVEPPRDYLGASRIGEECERMLQFEYFNAPKDAGKEFSGRILRVFDRGRWVEDYVAGLMREAGVELLTEDENSQQFGFSWFDGRVRGHCDGVLISGPEEFGPFPRLWECKGLGEKYFNETVKHGLKKSKQVYYGQVQIYQQAFGLTENPALFSTVNANTMDIHWDAIHYDDQYFKMLYAKAQRVIMACDAGELLPRGYADRSFWKCKACAWSERCNSL